MLDTVDHQTAHSADGATDPLRRIAALLGCPIESLRDKDLMPWDIRDLAELIELWSQIDDPAARSQVLTLARQVARSG